MTDTRAFLSICPQGDAVHVGCDLRPSSGALVEAVISACEQVGVATVDHGAVPTPALALVAMQDRAGAIMVTGSHIPADRNGLKFYRPDGEIGKADETAILAALDNGAPDAHPPGERTQSEAARTGYIDRYLSAFGPEALRGLRIGVYEHSSVARDIIREVLLGLGAEAVALARSDTFIPVDTEAVDPGTRNQLSDWCRDHALDALVSTDGDADRPMVTDATGRIVPGDVLGPITARFLGAETICTPVSSNTMVDEMGLFQSVRRTKIGSPFVIAAMEEALPGRVVGYEANGGFLLGFEAFGGAGPLASLMTRDCLLPIIVPLVAAKVAKSDLQGLVAALPARFTASDRLTEIPTEKSKAFIDQLSTDTQASAAFFAERAPESTRDLTDGLRIYFSDNTIIHLRPSGNAPEFRCYTEASSPEQAETLLRATLAAIRKSLK